MSLRLPLIFFLVTLSHSLFSQLKINEVLPANYNGITDEDNEFSDWLEIYNTSVSAVNLGDYSLSDDIALPLKWRFPNVELPAKSYLLVFASGKDRNLAPLTFTTVIDKNDTWKYTIPTADLGTSWQLTSYDDSSWASGPTGIGYGDDDDATVIDKCQSIFTRKEFTISDVSSIEKLWLHIDYDDGFVAYINGVEIARGSVGTAGVPYNAMAAEHEANVYRNGVPEAFEVANPKSFLVNGTNVLAIQVHNTDASSSDMTFVPYLTIGSSKMGNGNSVHPYFNISTNYLHTNFKLNKDGDTVCIYNTASQLVDKVITGKINMDVSYGRQPDGTDAFQFFAEPSPMFSNDAQIGVTALTADSVLFSAKGGTHLGGLTLTLSTLLPTDKIYFATDGSVPTNNSTLYSSPINITADTIVKARIYRNGALPGPITTHTYIVNHQHKFPITTLSTDPKNLWDEQQGIYILGPNAEPTKPYYGANYWMEWEKPATFEVYDTNGKNVVNQGVGIKIFGGYSRTHAQKSMAVFARQKYGSGNINYDFFDDKQIDKFESIVLRNGGTDGPYCIFRDGLFTGFTRKMDIDRMAFKPSAHYLNGKYWGILNIREKVNEHFLADNHKFNTEDLNLLALDGSEIIMGNNNDYRSLLIFTESNDLQTSANYQEVLNRMDVDNYIQYQLTQIFIANGDWPGNNIKFWRINTPDSKWRWILFDTDYSFGIYQYNDYETNSLANAMDDTKTAWPNPAWSTLLFRQLLTSTTFRNNFITQYCDHLNTTFLPNKIDLQIDSLKNLFDEEVQYHKPRWNETYGSWLYQVERLKVFSDQRPSYAINHLVTAFGLGSQLQVQVSVNDINQGQVKLNSIVLDDASFTGNYFQNIPIALKALPKPGYKFVRWEGAINSTSSTIAYNMQASASFYAVFEKAADTDINIVINEINYKSATTFNTEDWIELYNNGSATVDLSNWFITDLGKEPGFYIKPGTILYPGEYIVVCGDLRDFRNFRPTTKNSRGSFAFGLSSESKGDKVRLYNAEGVLKDFVDYYTTSPWPVIANESGATLELKSPTLDNTKVENWVANPGKGTPGKPNSTIVATDISPTFTTQMQLGCFPNPFKNYTTIELVVAENDLYNVVVLDMNGRTVKQLVSKYLTTDTYYFNWDGANNTNQPLSNGVYLIKCTSQSGTKTIKVIKTR